jgi:hypothetical protein
MGGALIERVLVAVVRAVDWILPANRWFRIAFGVLVVWAFWIGVFYVSGSFGSRTSPSGYSANAAHGDFWAAFFIGTLFTAVTFGIGGAVGWWYVTRPKR